MNILIVSLAYAPYSGVGAARMTSLSEYLIKKNNKVTVLCYDSIVFGEAEQKRVIPEGVVRVCVKKKENRLTNNKYLKRTLDNLIGCQHFDVCISSIGPCETMFFIDKVCKKHNLPFLIDYRDPWIFERNEMLPKGILKYKVWIYDHICQFVEKRVIRNAVRIVSVTKQCQDDLIKRYEIDKSKFVVIYNGYEKVPLFNTDKNEVGYTIGIAGKFSSYNSVAANMFMEVCAEIEEKEPITLLHIGARERIYEEKYMNIYHGVGERSYIDAMNELAKADALLISYAHTSGLGTKVFDYIALNKPILYVGVVPSELATFVGQFENSYICADKESMRKSIVRLLSEKPYYLTKTNREVYSREKQNEIYWNMLLEIVG